MINELIVRKRNAFSNNIERQIALSSEYKIRRIDGLGPVKADIVTLPIATDAGTQFISTRNGERNIVIKIEFNPNYAAGRTITTLRRELYKVLMPGETVDLLFDVEPDGLQLADSDPVGSLYIQGRVESHEPDIFAENPSVVVSIICPFPYFKGQQGLFDHGLPTSGTVRDYVVPYEGNVPVGFVFEFAVTSSASSGWMFTGRDRNDYFGVAGAMQAGDIFRVSTVKDDRYVRRVRGGQTQSVLGYLTGSLNDMKLYPGDNHFTFSDPGITSNRHLMYEVLYGGL